MDIQPPEKHHVPIMRLIEARSKLTEELTRKGEISLADAEALVRNQGSSLEEVLARLPAGCWVDWTGGKIKCR